MQELTKVFHGIDIPVEYIDEENMWFDVSGVAHKHGKKITDWNNAKRTKEIVKEVEKSLSLGEHKLIKKVGQNTKIHRSLFVNFARFISVEFEIAADKIMMDILLGKKHLCEEERQSFKNEIYTLELKLQDANELKTYKEGRMALRKYLKDRGLKKDIKEDIAWEVLVIKGIVKNEIVPTLKRALIDYDYGYQTDIRKAPVFNPDKLDEIFLSDQMEFDY